MGEWGRSRNFTITAGVKQGCVLSPRLFSATLEWALRGWKKASQGARIDLRDGFLFFLFFPSRLFAAIGSQGAVLLVSFQALGLFLYWPVSRCAKSKAKSINESGKMWG